MYSVTFGIKLENEENGAVFGNSNKKYKSLEKAKMEANTIFKETICEMFEDIVTDGLFELPNCCLAWYEDNPNQLVVARMDGTFDCGEFYVLITKDKELN